LAPPITEPRLENVQLRLKITMPPTHTRNKQEFLYFSNGVLVSWIMYADAHHLPNVFKAG
jgi:hypothetical protein